MIYTVPTVALAVLGERKICSLFLMVFCNVGTTYIMTNEMVYKVHLGVHVLALYLVLCMT